jgi:iron complex outermembrane receptor protein
MIFNDIRIKTIAFAILLAWTDIARAQSTEEEELALAYGDKTVVSIATGSQIPIARAPAVATVITARDIEAMGATDLDQVLESVPGLHVSVALLSYNSIYSFRGIFTGLNAQVLMLINGIPINVSYAGNRGNGIGGIPVENIARIEVLRGPGSALYGADAFSGVINIITKTAADIKGTEYGARVGSFKTRDAWIQYGGNLGSIEAAFYLRAGRTDGQNSIVEKDLQSVLDGIFKTNLSHAPGPVNLARDALDASADLSYHDWRLRAAYRERKIETGVGLSEALDPVSRFPTSRLYLDLTYQKENWIKNWDITAVAGYFDIKEKPGDPIYHLLPAGTFGGAFPDGLIGNPGHSERHTSLSISGVYNGFTNHRIRIGTGHRLEDLYETTELKNFTAEVVPGVGSVIKPIPGGLVDATGNPNLIYLLPQKRTLTYLFAQDEWTLAKDWALTAGVRKDRYSDFGSTTNPRLALVWDAAYNLVIKALHGRAFRAPSFVEEHALNNPTNIGNPNLQPETNTTDELAFAWQPRPDLRTNLTFFHYQEKNIILFVPNLDPTTGSTAKNAGNQTGRGLEFEATWDFNRNLRFTGNYSLQHSTDEATGEDAGLAPHHRLFARADWRFSPSWQFGATVNHVADRKRQPGDARPQIADYTTVDLSLRREKLFGNWEARLAVQNLFNQDAREPSLAPGNIPFDLPLPRRSFYIQLQHNL